MRCRTQCSDNYFESPKRVESKFHKPSRSEDFYFVNQAPSILSSYQNLSKVANYHDIVSSLQSDECHLTAQENLSHVSANSVNYSSVHELSVLLENEREQHQRNIQAITSEKNSIIADQEKKIAQLSQALRKLQQMNKRLLMIDVEPNESRRQTLLEMLDVKRPKLSIHNSLSSQLKKYEEFTARLLDELGLGKENALQNMEAILKTVQQERHLEKEQSRFVKCIKDLIVGCAPKSYFDNNDPSLKQVWKYLKGMLGECVKLKNENQKYKVQFMVQKHCI